jgi:hypothetical protein
MMPIETVQHILCLGFCIFLLIPLTRIVALQMFPWHENDSVCNPKNRELVRDTSYQPTEADLNASKKTIAYKLHFILIVFPLVFAPKQDPAVFTFCSHLYFFGLIFPKCIFFVVLGPLNSFVWYVPSSRYSRGLG